MVAGRPPSKTNPAAHGHAGPGYQRNVLKIRGPRIDREKAEQISRRGPEVEVIAFGGQTPDCESSTGVRRGVGSYPVCHENFGERADVGSRRGLARRAVNHGALDLAGAHLSGGKG